MNEKNKADGCLIGQCIGWLSVAHTMLTGSTSMAWTSQERVNQDKNNRRMNASNQHPSHYTTSLSLTWSVCLAHDMSHSSSNAKLSFSGHPQFLLLLFLLFSSLLLTFLMLWLDWSSQWRFLWLDNRSALWPSMTTNVSQSVSQCPCKEKYTNPT